MARNDHVVRLLKLARILADSRRGLPLRTISERYSWPLRTLYRDIDALEAAGFEVIKEAGGRFRMPPKSLEVPPDRLQPDERLALFTLRQLAGGLRETATGRAVERLWQRLSGERPGTPMLLPTDARKTLDVRSPLAVDYSAHRRTIAVIEEALAESRVLSCRYEAISTGELTARDVEPGQLYWDPSLEGLYLIGWCRLRQAIRVFAVHRFRMVSPLRERFRPRPECASRTALRHAFRIWRGGHIQRVTVRLTGWAAREARERKLHRSQEVTPLPRGAVRVTLEVAGFEEVTRWILSYGAKATIEGPPELVDLVRTELGRASSAYSDRSTGTNSSSTIRGGLDARERAPAQREGS